MFKSDFLSVPFLALELKTMFLWIGAGIVQKIKGLLKLKNSLLFRIYSKHCIVYHNRLVYDTHFIINLTFI